MITATGGSHDWLARFSVRLMKLRPELDACTAIRRAVWCYGRCGFVQPETAAQMYAEPELRNRPRASDPYRQRFDGTTGATSQ